MKKPRRRSKPKPIGTVLGNVLEDLGLGGANRILRIGELWEQALGAEVARHCRPIALRQEVLEAEVDSSVWCQQLQMQAPKLLASLRDALGEDAPSDLRFRVGYARRR
jgi:predicted nucleic acid-binding Zn ribbon protein